MKEILIGLIIIGTVFSAFIAMSFMLGWGIDATNIAILDPTDTIIDKILVGIEAECIIAFTAIMVKVAYCAGYDFLKMMK